ncbi:hypothetical protein PIB30_009640 [Stylosanthes scabra]|uniref:Uncharacterized protein n=1 Tax=Stylosanthes scabra TaxID=79078 RepID=A0ABU6T550_9FABA|nr:hypothetical protein [Stylosanthes scabra]
MRSLNLTVSHTIIIDYVSDCDWSQVVVRKSRQTQAHLVEVASSYPPPSNLQDIRHTVSSGTVYCFIIDIP